MNQRFISVLVFAFLVASGASVLLYRLMASRVTTKAEPATAHVVVAARDLELGTLIRDSDVKLGDWVGTPPKGAAMKKEDVVGRGVVAAMYSGEPLLENRLAPKGAGGGLAAMIPAGMRAVAVRVNEVVGVAGFVVPGMRVDVLISGNAPGGNHALGSVTRTLMQNLEVLSAGKDFKKDNEGKPVSVQVVNLLVTPEQAEMLSLASNQTTIQLVLRNPLDTQVATPPGTALATLFGGMAVPRTPETPPVHRPRPQARPQPPVFADPPAPRKEPPVIVEVINGNKRVQTKFESAGEGQ